MKMEGIKIMGMLFVRLFQIWMPLILVAVAMLAGIYGLIILNENIKVRKRKIKREMNR